ncbi:MAG: VOC family protein [Rhodospirillales bacterium]|nr:VOC family protein [Rhodospirillales bacterium]MDP6882609.1 VOC family protein [Rhodospirillales bacterium]
MPPLVPTGDQVFLDHVGLFVPDLEASPDRYADLGFNLTPPARHGDAGAGPSGTGNRCAMFGAGYLEILGSTGEDTPLARQLRAGLDRYPGLHLIAFAVADAEAHHEALPGRGFEAQAMVRLRRSVPTEDGEATACFDVVRPLPGSMPEGRIQMLTHHTPELVWQPRYRDHANGALALSSVLVAVDDVAEAAARFARFLGRGSPSGGERGEVALDRGRLAFVEPGRLGAKLAGVAAPSVPYIAAMSLETAGLEATKRYFDGRDIPWEPLDGGRIRVPGRAALGAHLVFHEPDAGPGW